MKRQPHVGEKLQFLVNRIDPPMSDSTTLALLGKITCGGEDVGLCPRRSMDP
jgi:hypothetical protein